MADLPVGNPRRVKIEGLKYPQSIGREAIAATLVARENSLVDNGDLVAKAVKSGST